MQSISKSDALQERKPKLESMAVAGVDGLIGFDAIGPKYIHANSPSVKRICMPCVVKEAYGERGHILEIYRQRELVQTRRRPSLGTSHLITS